MSLLVSDSPLTTDSTITPSPVVQQTETNLEVLNNSDLQTSTSVASSSSSTNVPPLSASRILNTSLIYTKKQSYSAPGSKPWLKFIEYQDKKARLTTHVSTIDEYGEQLIQERLTYKHEHDIELKPLADYHGTMPKHTSKIITASKETNEKLRKEHADFQLDYSSVIDL
ncbi:hypothetical protein GLOIN_2v1775124 [Rhizophagus irregularis DAOM 181602=DAOM 197198]|uniref:Uncharacterized protein n=1 Tax=Rhizophagus irregularis (strain DAOM 181602 / DAOM 197198 / MUCL 43194) TaxID=747089 RepID=A0A2P4Q0S2_RHIID|nr:hypothetical protein GLOIN_2v1775124 [Rhizophagus irregularis DAOM 181602=DAOM 197198]POG71208.1 hypothetical protein GLOIN_2v1775124 [Rhizophagus irregularis DAOM 181602=DAOM 197198]|eukprot:XP_025178074.1 hypothetical protein GLOIN_2v1775124 [Rhizophagus irregularis DAOM 181602=DAOM 197198]